MRVNQIEKPEFVRRLKAGTIATPFASWAVTYAYADSADFQESVELCLANQVIPTTLTIRLSERGSFIVRDVFKLEEIDGFWEALSRHVGVSFAPLHKNRSRPRRITWDPRHVDRIGKFFEPDFRKFGYEISD